jgi:CRISPR/Cas system endoribonuclease Cas6 (RAMP superfamily)
MCRHKASAHDVNTIAHWFGLIPTEMRQYVRHAIALPASTNSNAYPTENSHESVVFVDQATLHDVIASGVAVSVGQVEYNY